jgi:hypothetical protein
VTQASQRVTGPLRGKEDKEVSEPLRGEEDQGVVADIIVAPQSIPIGRHAVVQARPLPESTEDLEWMN